MILMLGNYVISFIRNADISQVKSLSHRLLRKLNNFNDSCFLLNQINSIFFNLPKVQDIYLCFIWDKFIALLTYLR
jgi:hypothetical protein